MNKKERIIEKLKPFWEECSRAHSDYMRKVEKIEKRMNRELDLGFELEFFHDDGNCCGIGAKDFSERENFPLIHDSELWK
ncbi:MAG: hypothetical protein ABIH92_00450 [Nanoarchaeota archaeon]